MLFGNNIKDGHEAPYKLSLQNLKYLSQNQVFLAKNVQKQKVCDL